MLLLDRLLFFLCLPNCLFYKPVQLYQHYIQMHHVLVYPLCCNPHPANLRSYKASCLIPVSYLFYFQCKDTCYF